MSVQFLDGVKFGDTQMTIGGLITAGMFLALSRAAPGKTGRPNPIDDFHRRTFSASVICQFAAHLFSLWYTLEVAKAYVAAPEESESGAAPYVAFDAIDADVGGGNVERLSRPLSCCVCPEPSQHRLLPGQHVHADGDGGGQLRRRAALLTTARTRRCFTPSWERALALGVLTSQIFPELKRKC